MAPTTLAGQRTTSSPSGRDTATMGYPLPVTEMLSLLPGVAYAARVSVADPGLVGRAKAAIRRAFEVQQEGHGFGIVEVLSTCPVGWGMTPTAAMEHLATEVMAAYAVGTYVDRSKGISTAMPVPAGKPSKAAEA
jgi:2-oxoglutarate ferredoxin oxidoreductase subunit beta